MLVRVKERLYSTVLHYFDKKQPKGANNRSSKAFVEKIKKRKAQTLINIDQII